MPIYPERKFDPIERRSELDVLKSTHKFLRSDAENAKDLAWDDAVAHKFYSSLFREFAVCNLKHYKTGEVSLRWRTEDEVLSGVGETTCGNIRCSQHDASAPSTSTSTANRRWDSDEEELGSKKRGDKHGSKEKAKRKPLTVELPFAYEEEGTAKNALVKVVLCEKCFRKLNWKREKDKEMARAAAGNNNATGEEVEQQQHEPAQSQLPENDDYRITPRDKLRPSDNHDTALADPTDKISQRRGRRSRSRSPAPKYGRSYDIRDQWTN